MIKEWMKKGRDVESGKEEGRAEIVFLRIYSHELSMHERKREKGGRGSLEFNIPASRERMSTYY